jgi:hypothetical protein
VRHSITTFWVNSTFIQGNIAEIHHCCKGRILFYAKQHIVSRILIYLNKLQYHFHRHYYPC